MIKVFAHELTGQPRVGSLRWGWTLALLALWACDAQDGERGVRGRTGAQGETGPRGEPGADGMSGRDVLVEPNLSALDKAAYALGGPEAVQELTQLRYRATGTRYAQGERIEASGHARQSGTYTLDAGVDLSADALRTDVEREVSYPFAGPLRYSNIIRGELGFVSGTNNVVGADEGPMTSAHWASLRKEFALLNPLLIVRHALEHEGAATERGYQLRDGALHHVLAVQLPESYAGTQPVLLYVHAATGVIDALELLENDYLLRDVFVEVFYADWSEAAGVRMPRSVVLAVADEVVLDETRSELSAEPALSAEHFEFPETGTPRFVADGARRGAASAQWHEQLQSLGLPFDAEELTITPTEIAPGVFHITGAVHHSLVVEQQNGIVVVEAPLYPERADAIIAWVENRFPGKPITHAISTHHHVDHSAGLRSFVAEGSLIVASARAQDVYREAFTAPSSVLPDRLAREPRPARLLPVPVAGGLRLDDPARAIDVHHLSSSHSDDNVLISLPAQGVVFQSDLFSPGFPLLEVLTRELRDQIVSLGLDATLMPCGHGTLSSFAELEAALDAAE